MGIIDKITALLPRRENRWAGPQARADALALRGDIDRWLQELFEEPRGLRVIPELGWMPDADVEETDHEVVVTVAVPGLDRDELDLSITPRGLTIRGEKRMERKDKRRDAHISEYRYGSFVRTVPLPLGLDVDRAEARVKGGVLTVRFPKTTSSPGTRRIPIKT